MSDIEAAIKAAAEKSILKIVTEGNWIEPDYHNRAKIPADFMSAVWNLVDVNKIKKQIAARLESELADRIVNHLAAEISTDIKQILSVQERREKLRAIARNYMEEIMQTGIKK